MPWDIRAIEGEFCVVQRQSGATEGCHATRTEAEAQMVALYASEEKTTMEVDMDKAQWDSATVNRLPDSSFLHVESGGEKDEEGRTTPRSLRHFPYKDSGGTVDLSDLRNALSRLGQTETGTRAGERWLTAALRERLASRARRLLEEAQKSVLDKLADGLKALFNLNREKQGNSFTVWKEGETWRWLAVYSNKFRDRDDPPEILAEASHKEFMRAVDEGKWEHPEVRLWHVPGTRFGKGDFLAYDDRGFAIAAGTVENEAVAKALSKDDDLGVSHGMPKREIEYDKDDKSIIVRYRTEEISALPSHAAANELTGFAVLEDDMALPENKKDWLREKLGDDGLAELESMLGDKAKDAEGLEFKEEEEEESQEEESQEPEYVTRDEVAEAVGQALSGFQEQIATLVQGQEATAEVLKSLAGAVSELKQEDGEKLAKMSEETPAASLADMIMSVIGDEGTRIDGRTKLAKDAPKEEMGARTGIPVVDALMGDGDWQKALEA